MKKIYSNVIVWDAESKTAKKCDVCVDGEKFTSVKPTGTFCKADDVSYFDGHGSIALIPGFKNAHGHAAMTLVRGLGEDEPLMDWLQKKIWPIEAKMNGEMIYHGEMLASLEMIATGTTLYADHYFYMDDILRAAKESGLKAGTCRCIFSTDKDCIKQIENDVRFAKEHNGEDRRFTVQLGPHAPYTVSLDLLKTVADAAKENDLAVQMHWLETEGERSMVEAWKNMTPEESLVKAGLTDVKHLLLAHCVHVHKENFGFYARNNVTFAHNSKCNWKLSSGAAPVDAMNKAGICVAIGTDGAASNNRLDMWDEMRFAALAQKGATGDPTALTAETALKMATYNAAKALGFDRTGLIKEGYDADFILVNLDRPHYVGWNLENLAGCLVYAGSSADIVSTVVNGETLYNKGKFTKLDAEKILADARETRKKLTA